jgi:protein PsiE
MKRLDNKLHWTTEVSEKLLLATIGFMTVIASVHYVYDMYLQMSISLADLFMLFIYAEVLGMVGAFYQTTRIPVTLPIIIAITALCRLIILHSKEMESMQLLAESGAIAILAGSAYLMSLKDKMSLEKMRLRDE